MSKKARFHIAEAMKIFIEVSRIEGQSQWTQSGIFRLTMVEKIKERVYFLSAIHRCCCS